jgi:hypothetical protein
MYRYLNNIHYKVIGWAVILFVLMFKMGQWMDATQPPIQSDVAFCLGGGTLGRVKKTFDVFNQGYVKHVVFLGESWYNQPYIKKFGKNVSYALVEKPKNTQEEIVYISHYMQSHHQLKALIVTDVPHSLRVKLLIEMYASKMLHCQYRIVPSRAKWWHSSFCFANYRAFRFVVNELVRLPIISVEYMLHQYEQGRKNAS